MPKNLKILVMVQSYPDENGSDMAYVHTRNQYYIKYGCVVSVLSFSTAKNYYLDRIPVYCEQEIKSKLKSCHYDVIISHAPNIKNHLRFLLFNFLFFRKIIFVIHGHEVLNKISYYPKPYPRLNLNLYKVGSFTNILYDYVKLFLLSAIFRLMKKGHLHFIFVSEWMRQQFCDNLLFSQKVLSQISSVIPNSTNQVFVASKFNYNCEKVADFITIRPLDLPKYAIDLVLRTAILNPDYTFHVYGQGTYFKYYMCPPNLKVYNTSFKQHELPNLLNKYKAALMPTRLDSQGVMVCEMATFGMPIVTSDLPICREVLKGYSLVEFQPNNFFELNAKEFLNKMIKLLGKNDKSYLSGYEFSETIDKELEQIAKMVN